MRLAYSGLPGVRADGLGWAKPWQLRQIIRFESSRSQTVWCESSG
jgi:hypothetical protein